MREVGVLEAKTKFSALLDSVETKGEDFVITRHGRPIARLMSFRERLPEPMTGSELEAAFAALRAEVREDWGGEPEFDWKKAIEDGRE